MLTLRRLTGLLYLLTAAVAAACGPGTQELRTTSTSSPEPSATALSYVTTEPGGHRTSLRCELCMPVEVLDVPGPETVVTPEGPVRLYGAFVAPDEENCAELATYRLRELAGSTVRLEHGTQENDSNGTPVRYIYTAEGDSIDELFIREGLARTSAFEGSHSPWLLVTADNARQARSGCIWENYDRLFPQRTPRSPGAIN